MKKINTALFYLSFLLTLCSLSAGNDLSDLRGLSIANAKIPIYNRSGKPQMMIFVSKAERRGRVISGQGTVLDFLRPHASVDDIRDAWQIALYPLKAPFGQVFDFWLPRLKYSEAIVRTSQADIDRENHKASGSSAVFLRSPMLDLDGIGFEADFKRREIRINSEIEVLIRTSGSDPRKISTLKNRKYQYITATGDSLLIELENKRITLIGSVEIHESQATITCDRLTIVLSRDKEEKKTAGPKKGLDTVSSGISGISRLLADGNVVVSGADKKSGQLYADHLIYDLRNSEIILSSDTSQELPVLKQLRSRAAFISKAAVDKLPGYVVLDNGQMRSLGTKVTIKLNRSKKDILSRDTLLSTGASGIKSGADPDSLRSIVYPDGVFICGKESKADGTAPFAILADYCEYLPSANTVHLRNNVYAREENTELSCDTAELKLKPQLSSRKAPASSGLDAILCRRNVRLHHHDKKAGGSLASDKADFLPGKNKIVFYENVKAGHAGSKLSCHQLELFLADRSHTGGKKSAKPSSSALQNAASSAKILQKAVATGNVVMTDPRAVLNTGLLTMYFRELRPGEHAVRSMLQAGSMRLTRIECDNGIKLVSQNSPAPQKSSGFFGKSGTQGAKNLTAMRSVTDMETHISTFSGNVMIHDAISKLECGTMRLHGSARAPISAAVKKTADPDADPFALAGTENRIPTQILIGDNMELKKVECLEKVVLSRQVDKKLMQAGGERADYDVRDGKIILSGKAPDQAWIKAENRKQTSDRLIYHLAEERFESSGNTTTTNL